MNFKFEIVFLLAPTTQANYTIPPATQATIFLAATAPFAKSNASYFRFARFNTSTLYYLRAWHRLTMKEVMVHIYRKIKQISLPFFRSCCVDALKKSRGHFASADLLVLARWQVTHFQFLSVFQDGGHVKFPILGLRGKA